MVENIKQQETPEQSANKIREKRFNDDLKNKNALEKTDAPKAMEKSKNLLDKELVLQGCKDVLQDLDATNQGLKNFISMESNQNADDWNGAAIQNGLKDYISHFNTFKKSFNEKIGKLQSLTTAMPEISKSIQSLRSMYYAKLQEYQGLLMGVGGPQYKTGSDAYETIAYAGNTTKGEIQKNTTDMVKNLTVSSSLNYLRQLHSKMNTNEMQSDTVRNYYKEHITTMHQALIQKVQSLPAGEEKKQSLYELVNIISGHDERVDKGFNRLKDSVAIDTTMAKALLQQFLGESEVLKKVNASQTTPVFQKNYNIGGKLYTPDTLTTNEIYLSSLKSPDQSEFSDITGLSLNAKNTNIKDLTPGQQIVMKSYMDSMIECRNSTDLNLKMLEGRKKNYNYYLNKNFEERSEKSLDKDVSKIPTLTENDRKIVNLYKNIQGVGAQISDEALKSTKEYGIMGAGVTAFVAGSVLTGGVLGVYGASAIGGYVGSAGADLAAGKGYRSSEEIKGAALNYTINAGVAVASTALANTFGHRDKVVKVENPTNSLSKEAIKQNVVATTSEWKTQGKVAEVVTQVAAINTMKKVETNMISNVVKELPEESIKLYERYSFLKDHQEFLGNITNKDIMGEGVNAIVLKHPERPNFVVKIAKPGKVDNLVQEFEYHNKIYKVIEEGKRNGLVSEKIKIPSIREQPTQSKNYFIMEKIQGQNLHTECLRNRHREVKETKELLDQLTDHEYKQLLIEKYKVDPGLIQMEIEDYSVDHLRNFTKKTDYPLPKALEYLRKNNLKHDDIHPGNIMIDKIGNIYIIDFGRVNLLK